MLRNIFRYTLVFFKKIVEWASIPILLLGCIIIRKMSHKIDIGIGITPNINHIRWKQAIIEKGHTAETFIVGKPFYITKDFDFIYNKRFQMLFPLFLFFKCASRYKIQLLRFNGGVLSRYKSRIKFLEPRLLKLAGVKTIVIPYGSDCRLLKRTPNKYYAHTIVKDAVSRPSKALEMKIDNWCKYADIVVGQMDHVDYLPYWNKLRQALFALDTDKIRPHYPKPTDTVKILHIVNHFACKGTNFVLKAVEELQKEGFDIELIFKNGISNDIVMQLVQETDIVVDQLVIGWYGAFASEAMAYGKPTICYLRKDLVKLYEKAECILKNEIPIISADVLSIKSVLKELIQNKHKLSEIGRQSRAYCLKYHSKEVIGSWFSEVITDILSAIKEKR